MFMCDNLIAITAFIVIGVSISIISHKYIKIYLLACIVSGVITITIYQIIHFFIVGYLDPYFQIVFIIGGSIAFLISVIVGIPVRYGGKNETGNRGR